MRFAIWVFLLLVVFPLDALQITPNVAFIVLLRIEFFQGWSLCLRGGDTGVDFLMFTYPDLWIEGVCFA